MTFAGLRDHEDPGLDMRRLALTGAVTETRQRRGIGEWFRGLIAGLVLAVAAVVLSEIAAGALLDERLLRGLGL